MFTFFSSFRQVYLFSVNRAGEGWGYSTLSPPGIDNEHTQIKLGEGEGTLVLRPDLNLLASKRGEFRLSPRRFFLCFLCLLPPLPPSLASLPLRFRKDLHESLRPSQNHGGPAAPGGPKNSGHVQEEFQKELKAKDEEDDFDLDVTFPFLSNKWMMLLCFFSGMVPCK